MRIDSEDVHETSTTLTTVARLGTAERPLLLQNGVVFLFISSPNVNVVQTQACKICRAVTRVTKVAAPIMTCC